MQQVLVDFRQRLEVSGFQGGILYDLAHKVVNATDNSIYELQPLAVIEPKNANDLKMLVQIANEKPFLDLTFTPRGGGTGTNGQALTSGIVVDTSRYMTRVLDFSKRNRTVTVEPGVVLSELNRYLKPHGLMFAPNISTADRATIGGMIATDAAGKGSLVYGKTSDHIDNVTCLTIQGASFTSGHVSGKLLQDMMLRPDKIGQIYRKIKEVLSPLHKEIAVRFPNLKRPLSGYDLRHCYNNGIVDLARLIAGSEGTLAFITQAKLKLTPIPKHKRLVVVHYATFLDALADAAFLIQHAPLAIEAVDDKVQQSATTLPNWPELAKLLNSENQVCISNFIEFAEDDAKVLEEKIVKLTTALKNRGSRFVVIANPTQIAKLWGVRSLAVGLAANVEGARKPVAFVEDAIVPPENLHAFVREFEQLLQQRNLDYAMYGHVDVGCIHVRPALDMTNVLDRSKIRSLTQGVIKLTDKYHGLLWGEHGKGFRGEFVAHVFGPTLYKAMAEIKAIFDPHNRLNPGKLVAPDGNLAHIDKIDMVPMRGEFDQVITPDLRQEYAHAMLCNGNGACFNHDSTNVMCPSYKATKNRIHSPKGRASLVKEWLRARANNITPSEIEAAEAVFAAMSGCLGCKACTGKCPTKVSIPDLKSKFLNTYHATYRKRSMREYALGHIEHILQLASHVPRLWNTLIKYHLTPRFGMVDIPTFANNMSLRKKLRLQNIPLYKNLAQLASVKNPVIIVADVFSGLLDQKVLFASLNTLRYLGYSPYVIYPRVSGKALLVGGFLDKFKLHADQWGTLLNPLFTHKIPVVGIENSVTLIFRHEFATFASALNGTVLTLAELLAMNAQRLQMLVKNASKNMAPSTPMRKNIPKKQYALLSHCTEQATHPLDAAHWQKVFASIDQKLEAVAIGCCGMAGTYGHQHEHQVNSRKLFSMNWQPQLEQTQCQNLATGYSCRAQSKRFIDERTPHPIEALWEILQVQTASV